MKRVLAVLAVIAVVVTGAALVVRRTTPPSATVQGLRPAVRPAEDGAVLGADAIDGVFSPDGTKLAIRGEDGVSVLSQGRVQRLRETTSRVVAVAWFPRGNLLLVAEGPSATGRLAVVREDGAVDSVVNLDRPVPTGSGYGLAVSPDGRTAAMVQAERAALSPRERRALVLVDLATGRTSLPLADRPFEVADPVFLDERSLAFTQETEERPTAAILRLDDLEVSVVSPAPTRVVGAVERPGGRVPVWVSGRDLVGSGGLRLGQTPEGTTALAVDPTGSQVLVRREGGGLRLEAL